MSTSIGLMLLSLAQGVPGQGDPSGSLRFMIIMFAFLAIMWFLIITPQRRMQKKHQKMVTELKKGDEVVTEGGIIGTIVHLTDDRLTIKTGESTRIMVARGKIARVMGVESEKS